MTATPKEVREARAFLSKRGITSKDIPPRMFASTANRMKKSFSELLRDVARLQLGGQGQGPAPIGQKLAGYKGNVT